jgi:hypothetical protein
MTLVRATTGLGVGCVVAPTVAIILRASGVHGRPSGFLDLATFVSTLAFGFLLPVLGGTGVAVSKRRSAPFMVNVVLLGVWLLGMTIRLFVHA